MEPSWQSAYAPSCLKVCSFDTSFDSDSESNQVTASIALMFDTPDTPEYTALTEVLVRYIAVRDELVPDPDSDSSDSDSS